MGPQRLRKPAPPGEMVDIGGMRLYAHDCGQGKPTVILEPALGGFSLQYAKIQAAVSAFTHVFAYDRAGQGWSDTSPKPRTPVTMAGELNALLGKLGIQPPYVMVGHSFGGLLTRIYAGLYPEKVAGVVLIDSTHVDEYASFGDIDKFVSRTAKGVRVLKLVSYIGLGKQLTKLSLGSAAKSIAKEDLDTFLTLASQPKHHENMLAEFSQHRRYYGPQSEVPASLGDIPLIVVTAGESASGQGKIAGMTGEEVNAQHQRLQKDLVRLSSQGEQITIPGANHFSIIFRQEYADQVAEAIWHMVEKVREEMVT